MKTKKETEWTSKYGVRR